MSVVDLSGLRGALWWTGDHLQVVDQTRLPREEVVRELRTAEEVVDAIRRLVVRGAPALGCAGALGMVLGLDEAAPPDAEGAREALARLEERIGAARPTAVNLSWALRRVRRAAEQGADPPEIRERALAEALTILEEDREACRRIGEYGRAELVGISRVLTHCNTGRLATAGWGTALGVVYAKAAAGEPIEVYACETRPLLQGARLTAWELGQAGIPVTLVADAAAPALLQAGMVGAVVVGADRIARNGDVANKVGTYGLALAARQADVPLYVAAPRSTFDLALADGSAIVIEFRHPEEVLGPYGAEGVEAWNPAFDVTSHELVTAFITDAGILRPPFEESIERALEAD